MPYIGSESLAPPSAVAAVDRGWVIRQYLEKKKVEPVWVLITDAELSPGLADALSDYLIGIAAV